MKRVFVPVPGDTLVLAKPWAFECKYPHYNDLLIRALNLPRGKGFTHVFPAGTTFELQKMYVNNARATRFVRLSTRINNRKPYIWAKVDDINKMEVV